MTVLVGYQAFAGMTVLVGYQAFAGMTSLVEFGAFAGMTTFVIATQSLRRHGAFYVVRYREQKVEI